MNFGFSLKTVFNNLFSAEQRQLNNDQKHVEYGRSWDQWTLNEYLRTEADNVSLSTLERMAGKLLEGAIEKMRDGNPDNLHRLVKICNDYISSRDDNREYQALDSGGTEAEYKHTVYLRSKQHSAVAPHIIDAVISGKIQPSDIPRGGTRFGTDLLTDILDTVCTKRNATLEIVEALLTAGADANYVAIRELPPEGPNRLYGPLISTLYSEEKPTNLVTSHQIILALQKHGLDMNMVLWTASPEPMPNYRRHFDKDYYNEIPKKLEAAISNPAFPQKVPVTQPVQSIKNAP